MTEPKNTTPYTHWMIWDGIGHVDGDVFGEYDALLSSLSYHSKADYIVLGFNPIAMVMSDVTRDVAPDWWNAEGRSDTWSALTGDEKVCWLAHLYFGDEVGQMEARIWAEQDRADYYRDFQAAE